MQTASGTLPMSFLGLGFARVWRRFFFLASIFQRDRMFKPTFVRRFLRRFLVRRFLCRFLLTFLHRSLVRRFFAQIFGAQIFAYKICRNIFGVPMALSGWAPSSSCFKSSEDSPFKRHNPPRCSPRTFASQRVLRGLYGGLFEGCAGSMRVSAGPWNFPRVVTLSLWPWVTVGALLSWAHSTSHSRHQAQVLKESAWMSVLASLGPKVYLCLLQDFSEIEICENSLCEPLASKTLQPLTSVM